MRNWIVELDYPSPVSQGPYERAQCVHRPRDLFASLNISAAILASPTILAASAHQRIYTRFAAWLAARYGVAEPSLTDFTPEAFVAYLDEREQVASPSTIKKERAALRELARYLHQLRLIDATVILGRDPDRHQLRPHPPRP